MMNKILQDLINTEEVAGFINNIIIEIEKEKGYNEVVEKVVRKCHKLYSACISTTSGPIFTN